MRKLIRNRKGAVTVFVTLLLIPAMLVSGTAVDLARLYTAKSIVQDANQLAGHALLANYDALLQSIYGLFGVAAEDPLLADMLNEYIEATVFGEDSYASSPGAFALFYGAEKRADTKIEAAYGQTLQNPQILRRQIEEYMKFRGPLVLVQDFLTALEDNTLKEDTQILSVKLALDADITSLLNCYKELYSTITVADDCKRIIGMGYFNNVKNRLKDIRNRFIELMTCYKDWETASGAERSDDEQHYQAILQCIIAYTGGSAATGYGSGSNWQNGKWSYTNNAIVGLNKTIENSLNDAEIFKLNFDAIVRIAGEIEELQQNIEQKAADLAYRLNNTHCDEGLKQALLEKSGFDGMSYIERYLSVIRPDDLGALASVYQTEGYRYIDDLVIPMLQDIKYRDAANAGRKTLTREQLVDIQYNSDFELNASVSYQYSEAAYFADFTDASLGYEMPEGFIRFLDCSEAHQEFFTFLTTVKIQPKTAPVILYTEQEYLEGVTGEEAQLNIIDDLLILVEQAYNELTNDPQGAQHLDDLATFWPVDINIFAIESMIGEAFADPIVAAIQDPVKQLELSEDYWLLLTYAAVMFSNYATTKPDSIGKTMGIEYEKTTSGVPLSPEVNYFYQSEWEYLYSGYNSAGKNLNAITSLLWSARLVGNYVTAFSVAPLNETVLGVQEAFAWFPTLGLSLGERARAALVAAETVVDVAALRAGYRGPLIKKASEWLCNSSSMVNEVSEIIRSGRPTGNYAYERGLNYPQYMLIFFIAKASVAPGLAAAWNELAERTGDLIEWNLLNYRRQINAGEIEMSEALQNDDNFSLAAMYTDFSITTGVDLRMLFLSMPFAQKGINGIAPPRTLTISITDYRGF